MVAFQPHDGIGLVGRQHLGVHVVYPQRPGNHLRAAAVIAGQQMAGDAARIQRLDCLIGAGLERVPKRKHADHFRLRSLLDQPGQRAPVGFPDACGFGQLAHWQAAFVQQAPIAQRQFAALNRAGDPAATQGVAVFDRVEFQLPFIADIQHGLGQRMFAAALQCARQLQQVLFIAQHRTHVGDARRARGQRAGLVEHHGIHVMGALQCFCVLDQNAVARRHTGSGHDRCWRREAQRARAGDHQHRDGVDQRDFQ